MTEIVILFFMQFYFFFLSEFIINKTAPTKPIITKLKTPIIINAPFPQEYSGIFPII